MSAPILVGNDVVDLGDPRCQDRGRDHRFVERVCAAVEIEAVRTSRDPDVALWILWAGKEAAFKVVTKALGQPPVFEHARFVVTVDVGLLDPWASLGPVPDDGVAVAPDDPAAGSPGRPGGVFGRVRYGDRCIPVRLRLHGSALHALAWLPDLEGDELARRIEERVHELPEAPAGRRSQWRRDLAPRLSEREWRAVHHPASAWARIHAREAARRRLGLPDATLEIVSAEGRPGRTPPRIEIDGRSAPLDVTLSHHGRYVAWALADGR